MLEATKKIENCLVWGWQKMFVEAFQKGLRYVTEGLGESLEGLRYVTWKLLKSDYKWSEN